LPKVRIGIDVGGTFTKAVAIDVQNYTLLDKCTVLTTHKAREGVAKGVINAFTKLLANLQIDPAEDISVIAHSTTQSTNSLLEGDVAPVGVIGMASGLESLLARGQTSIKNIELAPGRSLNTEHVFIDVSNFSEEKIKEAISELLGKNSKVIVASEAFGVDDPDRELKVIEIASQMGLPATAACDISQLYGLAVRTRTAIINGSILPKMMDTANLTEESIKSAGVKAQLMIMRGDGGVMSIDEMRRRPILTALSGPAASAAGALMYLRISDGIFLDVGGTSTDIGAIRAGKPMVKYAQIGGHNTYLSSLDVRTIGIAGGSVVRASSKEILDVGPRSAHIAGMEYSAFAAPEDIEEPEVVRIKPFHDDPADYIGIKCKNGKVYAITNTCAANALGLIGTGDYARGNAETARKAIAPLAAELGKSVAEVSREILAISAAKCQKVVNDLISEYKLDARSLTLVGVGGGAGALMATISEMMNLPYEISENAEVISSIGAALAMVRDVVERTVVNPTPEDILHIKREAEQAALDAGAAPGSVEVSIEVDRKRNRVKAIAMGAAQMEVQDFKQKLTLDDAKDLSAKSMDMDNSDLKVVAETNKFWVLEGVKESRKFFGLLTKRCSLVRVVDKSGAIRLRFTDPIVLPTQVGMLRSLLPDLLDKVTQYDDKVGKTLGDIYLLLGSRIIDLSGLTTEGQVLSLSITETEGFADDQPVVAIGIRKMAS
jgi:N-methylhydantoinase A